MNNEIILMMIMKMILDINEYNDIINISINDNNDDSINNENISNDSNNDDNEICVYWYY